MKLIGALKEKVEKAESLAEAKQEIAKAGIELTDEEVTEVTGGKLSSAIKFRQQPYCIAFSKEEDPPSLLEKPQPYLDSPS